MAERKYGRKRHYQSFDKNGQYAKEKHISNKIDDLISLANYDTDPFGSYTGVAENRYEVPVQDADDL